MNSIMKEKTYQVPAMAETLYEPKSLIAASITNVDGDADIEMGEGDAPAEADSRRRRHDIWEDEEEEESMDYVK